MILGLSTLGFAHTALSLLALAIGVVVVAGLVRHQHPDRWTSSYLACAAAATATGFALPAPFGIAHYLGVATSVALLLALLGRLLFRRGTAWRWIFVLATIASVYLFVFFTIGEAFLRVPLLRAHAPTLTEVPFALAQLATGMLFAALAALALRRKRQST